MLRKKKETLAIETNNIILIRVQLIMGGKDSPPPPCNSSKATKWSQVADSSSSSGQQVLPQVDRRPLFHRCCSQINLQFDTYDQEPVALASNSSKSLPRDYSPVKAYMDCISPQTLKCAIVGNSGVGKTSLLMSYTVEKFPETHAPTIYDKFTTSLTVSGKRIMVVLCDTAGQDDFAHLRPLCYPQLDVALICFSVVDYASFESVKTKWIKEITRHCPNSPIVLVGTQSDKRDNSALVKALKAEGKKVVSKSEGQRLAAQIRASSYIECSAFTQFNVKGAFDEAIAAALELNLKSRAQCTSACTIL